MGCKKCAEEGIPLSDCVCSKEDHSPLHQRICFPTSKEAEAVENEIGCDNCGRFAKLWSYAYFDLDLCAICSKKEGFRAEEPAVQEPDWIPDGDGRAIGQQNSAINLSPLHAESYHEKSLKERATTAYILIDNSGSANPGAGGGLNTFKDSARRAIDRLTKNVKEIVIIPMSYHRNLPTRKFTDKEKAKKYVNSLKIWGSTMSVKQCMATIEGPINVYNSYTFIFTDDQQGLSKSAESFAVETRWTNCENCGKHTNHHPSEGGGVTCSECNTSKQVDYSAESDTPTFEELKARQKKGTLEKEIAKKNDWVLEICKANIWEGDNSIKCPNCKDNLNAGWHTSAWPMNRNWEHLSDEKRKSALIRFPRGIQCFQCGNMVQMYRNDNAIRGKDGEWTHPKNAESVGTPSPTFNEGVTGQDGPSDLPTNSNFSTESFEHGAMCGHPNEVDCMDCGKVLCWDCTGVEVFDELELCRKCYEHKEKYGAESAPPTNQTFAAMRTMAPSTGDVDTARRSLKNSGYGEVIYDRYLINQQGSSNKFYYTAITEKDGQYYPMGAYGRIGYLGRLFNIAGKKERPYASFGSMELAYRQVQEKESKKINATKPIKRYVDHTLTRGAESLEEIEGPTAEATSGGLHSPSSFDISWEDGTGLSSASMPPNCMG